MNLTEASEKMLVSRHQCYRVYRHDNEYIKGETAWIKYAWGGKYEQVQEERLVQLEQLVKMSRSALPQAEIEAGDLWTKSTTGKMMFHGNLVRVTRTSPHK